MALRIATQILGLDFGGQCLIQAVGLCWYAWSWAVYKVHVRRGPLSLLSLTLSLCLEWHSAHVRGLWTRARVAMGVTGVVTCPWTSSLTRSLHGGHNGSRCPAAACLSATGLRAGNSGAQRPPRPCSSEPRHCPGQAPGPGFQLGIGTQGPCRRCLQRDDPDVSHAWNAGLPPATGGLWARKKKQDVCAQVPQGTGLVFPREQLALGYSACSRCGCSVLREDAGRWGPESQQI